MSSSVDNKLLKMDLADCRREILSLRKKIEYLQKKKQTKIPSEKLRMGRISHFMAKPRQNRLNRIEIAHGIETFSLAIGQIGKFKHIFEFFSVLRNLIITNFTVSFFIFNVQSPNKVQLYPRFFRELVKIPECYF